MSGSQDVDIDRVGPGIERALDPSARRRLGQHFTPPGVADLVAAFCLRDARDTVLDPACGTGAFLMRARARLKHLGGDGSGVLGVELDPDLAAAARSNLGDAESRRILTGDFLGRNEAWRCALVPDGGLDAIVGNPPYVRQELIDCEKEAAIDDGGPRLSRRADLHARFWPRALSLLRPGGRLGLVTSGTWLDAEFGGPLRDWIAEQFTVVAVLESEREAWFDDARVRAVATIVEKRAPRPGDRVRFVRLTRTLREMTPANPEPSRWLERLAEFARAVERGEPIPMGAARLRSVPAGDLRGVRWGPLLRQPDLHFELLARAGERLVPLEDLAEVRWGIKTGDDRFFWCAPGSDEVESEFLAPAVFRLTDLDQLIVTKERIPRRLVLIDLSRRPAPPLEGTRLLDRIRRAERERGSHLRPTCAARERASGGPGIPGRRWFELRPGPPGEILWSIMHQYRHLVPLNPHGILANDNLLLLRCREGVDPRLLAALLNSHLVALVKHAHGRQRNEGMLKTQAFDLRGMPVPDPRRIPRATADELLAAFGAIAARPIGKVADECRRADRQRLDRAALRAAGLGPGEADATADRLSACLIGMHAKERAWEVDATSRRRKVSPRRGASPAL